MLKKQTHSLIKLTLHFNTFSICRCKAGVSFNRPPETERCLRRPSFLNEVSFTKSRFKC